MDLAARAEALQRPLKSGSRFSANARIASVVSSVAKFTVWHRASFSSASAIVDCDPSCRRRLVIERASGGPLARRLAQPSTNAVELVVGKDPVHEAESRVPLPAERISAK